MPLATVILILVFNDLLLGKVKLATSCQFFEVVHFLFAEETLFQTTGRSNAINAPTWIEICQHIAVFSEVNLKFCCIKQVVYVANAHIQIINVTKFVFVAIKRDMPVL